MSFETFQPIMPSAGFDAEVSPLAALASGLPGVTNIASSMPGSSLTDILNTIASAYALDRQQKNFLELNQALIAQGRNPISWEQFGAQTSIGVEVDSGTKNTALIVGLALAGAIVLASMIKR